MLRFLFCRLNRQTIFVSWLAMHLLIALGLLSGSVMCFGGNGHIATERVHTSSQAPASERHGGPCLDYPLIFMSHAEHPIISTYNPAPQAMAPALISSTSPLPPVAEVLSSGLSPHRVPAPHLPRVSLSTVILI